MWAMQVVLARFVRVPQVSPGSGLQRVDQRPWPPFAPFAPFPCEVQSLIKKDCATGKVAATWENGCQNILHYKYISDYY